MKPYKYTNRIYNLCKLAIVVAVAMYWQQIVTTLTPYLEMIK